jgi:hypothetical protein
MTDRTGVQLPRWQCHKIVHAAKIERMNHYREHTSLKLKDLDPQITVSSEWWRKHTPEVGGYFVCYEDGYESYSPAAAFESGYTLLPFTTSTEAKTTAPAGDDQYPLSP